MAEDGDGGTGAGGSSGYPDYADVPDYAQKRALMGRGRLLHALAVRRLLAAPFRAAARLFAFRSAAVSPKGGPRRPVRDREA